MWKQFASLVSSRVEWSRPKGHGYKDRELARSQKQRTYLKVHKLAEGWSNGLRLYRAPRQDGRQVFELLSLPVLLKSASGRTFILSVPNTNKDERNGKNGMSFTAGCEIYFMTLRPGAIVSSNPDLLDQFAFSLLRLTFRDAECLRRRVVAFHFKPWALHDAEHRQNKHKNTRATRGRTLSVRLWIEKLPTHARNMFCHDFSCEQNSNRKRQF